MNNPYSRPFVFRPDLWREEKLRIGEASAGILDKPKRKINLVDPKDFWSNAKLFAERIKMKRYTQEQIDQANSIDLVSYLQSHGYELTRESSQYKLAEHDSLYIRGNQWY